MAMNWTLSGPGGGGAGAPPIAGLAPGAPVPGADAAGPVPALLTLFDAAAVAAYHALPQGGAIPGPELVFGLAREGAPCVALFPPRLLAELAAPADPSGPYAAFAAARKALRLSTPLSGGALPPAAAAPNGGSVPVPAPRPGPAPVVPVGSVIRAVIDDGIAVANARFRDGADTRILHHWDMGGAGAPGLPWGRAHDAAALNAAFAAATLYGEVEELQVYRDLGMVDFTADQPSILALRRGHGTLVADLFAGEDPGEGGDPILFVELPPAAVADTSGAALDAHMAAALFWLRDRAAEVRDTAGNPVPMVVNISYGATAGPHDGSEQLERLMDRLIAEGQAGTGPQMQIVLAAGNSHRKPCHVQVPPPAGAREAALTWQVKPDDLTPTEAEFWLPATDAPGGRAILRVTPPGGAESPALEEIPGAALVLTDAQGREVFALRCVADPGTGRAAFFARMAPTRAIASEEGPPLAPFGDWLIAVEAPAGAADPLSPDRPLRGWIQRDDNIAGYPKAGRQSIFFEDGYPAPGPNEDPDDPAFRPSDRSAIRREAMLNAIANGAHTIVAGAYERRGKYAMAYSAGGPVQAPDPVRPDLLMATSDSPLHRGRPVAATLSGGVTLADGTSVAAPVAARMMAEAWKTGTVPDRNWARLAAARSETALRNLYRAAPNLPLDRGGWGRMTGAPSVDAAALARRGVAPKYRAGRG